VPILIPTARPVAQQFSDVQLAQEDRLHGVLVYASGWIPVLIALMVWNVTLLGYRGGVSA
jgi:hypothetical protein